MDDNKKLQEMYERVMEYEQENHKRNQQRISIGLKCIYIIPLCFLVLLFLTDSSKIIFLTLWIASLFGIATYLIAIEYTDYVLQEKMHEIQGTEKEVEGLIDVTAMEERVVSAVERIEAKRMDIANLESPDILEKIETRVKNHKKENEMDESLDYEEEETSESTLEKIAEKTDKKEAEKETGKRKEKESKKDKKKKKEKEVSGS